MADPRWLESLPLKVIEAEAKSSGISWKLLAAIAQQESGGRAHAIRFEPKWKYFCTPEVYAKKNGVSLETERNSQMISWSYCQIMGGVARELGFDGPMPKLCDATLNFHFAALKLASIFKKYPAMDDAISAYNQGSNRKNADGKHVNFAYVHSVMRYIDELNGIA